MQPVHAHYHFYQFGLFSFINLNEFILIAMMCLFYLNRPPQRRK